MSDFRFATPGWSAALWVVLATVGALLWLEQRRGDALSRFLSPIMQPRLVSRSSWLRRSVVILLLGLASVCFVIALMRPQFGLTYVKAPRVGAQIMFCLDVSKSMLAEDVAPNRLDRAKADVTDLLTLLEGDQVGLIGFAGRASVLCPLTPDYGFFKLILDGAGPNSVGRGGTRLEEPLRKALDGFRSESDVSRVVFLITDGEDHDSHPLDVAKDAVERGIKIVAVGLGDEAGSEIRITDPRTGVQKQVRDADNRPVVTRLDGETLRKLALATEGVYIPAGTGSLDLKSIYDVHIQPLVRGEMSTEGRAIRRDAFQWMILAGLVFLIAAVVLGNRRAESIPQRQQSLAGSAVKAALVLAIASMITSCPAIADETQSAPSQSAPSTSATTADVDADQPIDARATYNQGHDRLRGNLDEAERLLNQARREAGGDGEVRFRATYNMGWVEINRADAVLEEEPEQALEHLQRAAGWFRDAVRLRGDADDARHNLEVVLLRITQLRDQLMKPDDQDLATKLDALITRQRQTIANLRSLVEQIAASEDPNIADQYRSQFQRLAVDQRVALSDLQGLVDQAVGELETLEAKAESDRTPEENIRIAQLVGLLSYLNQGNQRIGQSRSQLRRRQASRGFRRAATGLNQLKRARDQLRDPLEILDSISRDIAELAQQTAFKTLEDQVLGEQDVAPPIPRWIDQEFLSDSQADLTGRTEELSDRLAAGLENKTQDNPDAGDEADGTAEQQAFFEKLKRAMPHLVAATEAMKVAEEKLAFPDYSVAGEQQVNAIKALQRAKEQFADLRTLIELAYAGQQEIAEALEALVGSAETEATESSEGEAATQTDSPIDETATKETATKETGATETGATETLAPEVEQQIVDFITASQTNNLRRMERLRQEIDSAMASARSSQDESAEQESEAPSPEIQRLTYALQLADRASEQMNTVADDLPSEKTEAATLEAVKPAADPPTDDAIDPASTSTEDPTAEENPVEDAARPNRPYALSQNHARATVETLEDLRRLFFSIVEHLQETAQRQAGINDETEQIATVQLESEEEAERQRGKAAQLESRQSELSETAQQIATALEQQADPPSDSAGLNSPVDPQQQQLIQQNAERAKKAADLVTESTQQMAKASEALRGDEPQIAEARPPQDLALEKLIEALRELQPPQENQSDQQQENQQQQQSNENQQQEQQQDEQQDSQMDPSRVLQAVRDREAQRRREKDQRQRAGQVPVEKDW